MKITEPKTPFVRYNAELDTVDNWEDIDIPRWDLDRQNSNPTTPTSLAFNDCASNASKADGQQTMSPEVQPPELPQASEPPVSAGSEERRASFAAKQRSSSTGSRSSSRSTSFHLPDEDRMRLRRKTEGGEAVDGEDDELDPEAQAKHEAFVLARGRHYSNEAEAMKRAQQLADDEEEETEASQGSMELDNEDAPRTGRSKVPPVPPLPGRVNGVGK